MNYLNFLESKKHLLGSFGFEPNYYPDIAFDFQKSIIEKAVKKGRMAVFADTGLGKTLIQLSIAQNIVKQTNKKVLILTIKIILVLMQLSNLFHRVTLNLNLMTQLQMNYQDCIMQLKIQLSICLLIILR